VDVKSGSKWLLRGMRSAVRLWMVIVNMGNNLPRGLLVLE
jgi:hypothetical protein